MRIKSKVFPDQADEVIMERKRMSDREKQEAQRIASERTARIREVREMVINQKNN
jgi:hypothetical protein